ncbi:MAG: hypothetical protein WA071_27020 [Undibacterium umbellatum]|uniref:hypothetical protein n=1 Tax=Undibacterium umbellatum TaxID=2762300 RepID=UPI003BB5E439
MNPLRIERPHYFTGEALLTDDFICEQSFQMGMLATHNVSLYTYGIATGLVVSEPEDNNGVQQVQISAGVAIDRLGRQIILLQKMALPLNDIQPSTTYFITINYAEVFADYSNDTGTPGYKRIVQQPQLKYLRNLDEPGINILLAAVSFDANSDISNLTYQSQNKQRQYVATSVGAVRFMTADSGVNTNESVAETTVMPETRHAQILAQTEGSGDQTNYYLEFDAPRSQFMGHLSSRGNFGIGVDQPVANLQIDAVTFKGRGRFTTKGVQVTFDTVTSPPFQVGDILISDKSVGNGEQQKRTIKTIISQGTLVSVDKAFSPELTNTTYTYIRAALARFAVNSSASSLFQVNYDGSVGLGAVAAKSGQSCPNALTITSDRKVGIALSSGVPTATLDVNGNINTTGITSSGKIVAQSFEGNGSGLKNLNIISDWVKETPGSNASNLYYTSGNVGIQDSNPEASLSVGGGLAAIGSGVISRINNTVVKGYNTAFLDQVKPGDTLAIGTLNEQRAVLASQPISDIVMEVNPQFPIPVIASAFSVLSAATGDVTSGTGKLTSNGTTINGDKTNFTTLNAGDTIIIPRFTASAAIVQTCNVVSVASDTSLTLSSAFSGAVSGLTWQYVVTGSDPVTGNGKITVKEDPINNPGNLIVTGDGSNFKTAFPNGTGQIIASPVVSGKPQPWRVESVTDHNTLTLLATPDNSTPLFDATTSAFMVTNGLLAKFQTNSENGVLDGETEATLPPAMLILNNSDPVHPNTVGINVELKDILAEYALQVNGAVSFSGGGNFDDLTVNTLLAKQSITVNNTAPSGNLLAVGGPVGTNNLLTVSATAVTVSPTLSVQGTVTATSNVSSTTQLQAPVVLGTTSVQSPTAISNALNVTGLSIDAAGTVSLLGSRQSWSLSSGNTAVNSVQASTDGFVYGVISQKNMDGLYWGVITATSRTGSSNGAVVCTMAAATTTVQYTTPDGKGSTTAWVAVPGSFTMPVRKGEFWNVAFQSGIRGFSSPNAAIYWIPLGNGSASPYTAPVAFDSPDSSEISVASGDSVTQPAPDTSDTSATSTRASGSDISIVKAMPQAVAASSMLTDASSPSVDDLNRLAVQLSSIPNSEISGVLSSAIVAPVPPESSGSAQGNVVNTSDNIDTNSHPVTPVDTAWTGVDTVSADTDTANTGTGDSGNVADQFHQSLHNMVVPTPGANGGLATSVQDTINHRVSNLTNVLDSVTHTSASEAERQQFVQELQKIVCSTAPNGDVVAKPLDEQSVQDLIYTTSKLTGHQFTPDQEAALGAGIKALVQINESDANRNNLSLIKKNVDMFIDSLQQSLDMQFSTEDRRSLLRGLVTLVGDGRTRPEVAMTPPITPPVSADASTQEIAVPASEPGAETTSPLAPVAQSDAESSPGAITLPANTESGTGGSS